MTTHDTPEAALAAALKLHGFRIVGGAWHGRNAEDLAAAILAAMLDWTLVPRVATADWTGSTRKDAEVARLRAALTRHHRTLHVTQEWCTDCKRAALVPSESRYTADELADLA